jgi:hypothetical protein
MAVHINRGPTDMQNELVSYIYNLTNSKGLLPFGYVLIAGGLISLFLGGSGLHKAIKIRVISPSYFKLVGRRSNF